MEIMQHPLTYRADRAYTFLYKSKGYELTIEVRKSCVIVTGKIPSNNESRLYYHIREALNGQGLDLVKKEPSKDGHMTSAPYYLRDRKHKYCYMHNNHAIRSICEEHKLYGKVVLSLVSLE